MPAEQKKGKKVDGKDTKKKKGELSTEDLNKVSGGAGFKKPGPAHHHEDP